MTGLAVCVHGVTASPIVAGALRPSTERSRCKGTMRVVPILAGAKVALCPYCHRTVEIMRQVRDGAAGTLKSHPSRRY